MGIEAVINRMLRQIVVYWANPVDDGYGGYTFDNPVELSARWERADEIEFGDNGEEVVIKAHCYLEQDVEEGGYIYLGTLDDIDSNDQPGDVEGAIRIFSFSKIPGLNAPLQYIRKASLHIG